MTSSLFFWYSNRVFTEGTCKLLNLVISDLVDEDYVIHDRKQAVSALMFGTAALVSKPGQTLAPLIGTWLLSVQTGNQCCALHYGDVIPVLFNGSFTLPNSEFRYRLGFGGVSIWLEL